MKTDGTEKSYNPRAIVDNTRVIPSISDHEAVAAEMMLPKACSGKRHGIQPYFHNKLGQLQ